MERNNRKKYIHIDRDTGSNEIFAMLDKIHRLPNFDLTCAKVEEVKKRFPGFDNMQALYLYTSFMCTVHRIYLRNSC